jgi:ApeA N-terminal domain 1
MRDIKLTNRYEFDGMWWLPDESGHRYGGRLELSPARMTLTIFVDDPDLIDFPNRKYPTIHGIGTDGTPFTLPEAVPGGGRGKSLSVHANLCLIGKHLTSTEEPVYATAYFNLTHLEEWFAYPIFSQRSGRHDEDQHLTTASCQDAGSLIECSVPSHDVKVSSFHAVSTSSTWFTDLHWSCMAYVCVCRGNDYRPKEIVEVAHDLGRFWTMLSGIWCQEQQTRVLLPDYKTVYFYYTTPAHHDADDRARFRDMVFPFKELQDVFSTVMKAWWERPAPFDAASLLYHKVATRHHMGEYSILDIVDLVHAMDLFASIRGSTKIVNNSKQVKQVKEAVKSAIRLQGLKPEIAD